VAGEGVRPGDKVKLGVRPEHLLEGQGDSTIPGDVDVVEELGESHFLYVRIPDGKIVTIRASGDAPAQARSRLSIGVPGDACHVFTKDGLSLRRLQ
jgi:multiple sugar transport system ATP-binding protein